MSYNQRTRGRFMSKVAVTDGCWPWLAEIDEDGYGKFKMDGKNWTAQRAAHVLFIGPIPEGYEVDHTCRNRSCARPAHLEAVTKRVNTLRGYSFSAVNARKETCPAGHPYNEQNTWLYQGRRYCRTCRRQRNLVANRDRREGAAANG